MPRQLVPLKTLTFLALGIGFPVAVSGQAATAAALERWIRSGYEFSWESGQPMPDQVRQVWRQLGWAGVGYGFRTFQARGDPAESSFDQVSETLATRMEYWRVKLEDLHTSVVGGIGLAWGVHTEEFKVNGQPPETVRVRFTNTLRWDGEAWENLLFHRDAQLFDDDGRYRNVQD